MQEFIRHVGRGRRLARELPAGRARAALAALLADDADPVQVGAFLIAMRMKGESAEELCGFVEALREALPAPPLAPGASRLDGVVDVDLHGDGRALRPCLLPAAAVIAAAAGARPILRLDPAAPHARVELPRALAALGLVAPAGPDEGARLLEEGGPVVLELGRYHPRLAALAALRARLGLRTFVQTALKLLNPCGAPGALIGIFHSPYHQPVGGAAAGLGLRRALVIQAPGGLPEPPPERRARMTRVARLAPDGPATVDTFDVDGPALLDAADRGALPETADGAALAARCRDVLAGGRGPTRGAALLGAAAILVAAGVAAELADGVRRASTALDGGAAAERLARLAAHAAAAHAAAAIAPATSAGAAPAAAAAPSP